MNEFSSQSSGCSGSSSSTFKILIASDIHLGYAERDPVRGNDSFDSFEEVLQAASLHNVDFLLFAGDLFHLNKPSMNSINRAISLIRKYCLSNQHNEDGSNDGNSASSRSSQPLHQLFTIENYPNANFLDTSLNIKYPIFTIHGNHDDPIGVTQTSVIDLLDSCGLVNYFGKRDNVDQINLEPIVLTKGRTKIALYGLGSIHEERLANIIENNNFHYQPFACSNNSTEYFKIVLVHQNRVAHPNTKYLHPSSLQQVPNLVVWGHEHECIQHLDYFSKNDFHILQPGSTVATSLSDSEQGDKCYFILTVSYNDLRDKPKFKVTPYKLNTVRPFLMKSMAVENILKQAKLKKSADVSKYLFDFAKYVDFL